MEQTGGLKAGRRKGATGKGMAMLLHSLSLSTGCHHQPSLAQPLIWHGHQTGLMLLPPPPAGSVRRLGSKAKAGSTSGLPVGTVTALICSMAGLEEVSDGKAAHRGTCSLWI